MNSIKEKLNISREDEDLFQMGLKIYRVILNEESLELALYLESEILLGEKVLGRIRSLFSDKFPDFHIYIKIRYLIEGDCQERLDFYKSRLVEILTSSIESSKSWIDSLDMEFKDGILLLYPPNEMAYYIMERNGLKKKLSKALEDEISLDCLVKISRDRIEIKEDFLEDKVQEEIILAKKALESRPEIRVSQAEPNKNYRYGKKISGESIEIGEIDSNTGTCVIEGRVFGYETMEIRNNRTLVTFNITDLTGSITAKIFLNEDKAEDFLLNVKDNSYIRLSGQAGYDDFSKCTTIMIKSVEMAKEEFRLDNSEEKRIELHLHTKMSSLDAVTDIESLIKTAERWGHKAIAITDHGVVQAYPEAMNVEGGSDVKVIYGMEGYLVDDEKSIIENYTDGLPVNSYVVFDIETTGLSSSNDMITEIGAIKIKDNEVVETYSQLINPKRPIPEFIVNLTGITDDMVRDKPSIEEIIPDFYNFIEGSILVAHNAKFDVGFIREKFKLLDLDVKNPVIDTLELARSVFPDLKNHKLNTLTKYLGVKLENHHRAVDDAKATADIFLKILELTNLESIDDIGTINRFGDNNMAIKDRPYHIVLLAKNYIGLKNLYKIVSESHMEYFYRQPRIPKSFLEENREGILVGSACSAGELYQSILNNESGDKIQEIVNFYDYLEIQPLGNNKYLIDSGMVKDEEELQDINKKIYKLGRENNKLVVATGDVHFLEPEDSIFRTILMAGQGFKDADDQPPLYLKTTEEMLGDFAYMGQEEAHEVVIKNPNLINDLIEDIRPIPKETFPPVIENSDEDLRTISYNKAYELYGKPLPEIVEKRLERELSSIIKNGYSVMYIIAQKLVWKSIEDGYLVGSRGSVGSSLVATMSGITEINPLAPHYLCPKCQYSEFFLDGEVSSGADLKDSKCPKCNEELIKDGHDIPFEVFLGFEGDKEPDIDLNFAGEYQSQAHKYTEEIFGSKYVFRAGTIGTVAERTAYGFVKKYFEAIDKTVHPAEIDRLVKGCTGVRRTSGQHPGGVMIVPHSKDILDFSPIQYPANDKESGVVTTHFDYNAISSNILKLDILGHDVPTIIRMLEDITGVDPTKIPLDEKRTMSLFSSTDALGVTEKDINCKVGTLGIPEFGTKFVRQMLIETKPNTFSELVRISGLSHGTDVWINNAQELIRDGVVSLKEVISTREDIMLNLIAAGMDKSKAFNVMEKVRKGRGLPPGAEEEMRSLGVDEWYIDSCNKIKYMFPKAHAAAYVMMSFRIAYFKVYYPEAFYATYFTTKADDFDADLVVKGLDRIGQKMKEIEALGYSATTKEKNQLTVLEVAYEMYKRGYSILPVDLYRSDSDNFKVVDKKILPPLKCLDGLGANAARSIVSEREESKFISKEDLLRRTGVSRPTLEVLENHGCLGDLPNSNQMNFFG